jgi:CubicO group peptidase (beta-lactamase class C family)
MATTPPRPGRCRDIVRRDLLRGAAAAAAGLAAVPGGRAALAQTRANAAAPTKRAIEHFAKRVDLIRQSLDIPGMAAAVLHRQTAILARGFGMADVAHAVKATEHTPYPIASVTKTFAAAVIMRLVEQGKLDLDAPMATYDPEYGKWCAALKGPKNTGWPNFNCDTARITVRQHLNHTEQGTPGTNFEYSAFLFARLTQVIDAVSPKGYLGLLDENILGPLGMTETALGSKDPKKADVVARMARPYALNEAGDLFDSGGDWRSFDRCTTSSGIISTVADLAKYDIGIDRDLVYSVAAKQQIWTPTVSPTGQVFPYGLGWFVQGNFGSKGQLVWHYGEYPTAFSAMLFKIPDRQLTLIFLASTERASSVFQLGNGDPLRSAFVTAFLDEFDRVP